VSVIRRMTKLKAKLLAIRLGPGAAILPPEVAKIHMDFAYKLNDGHMGPRKFWQNCLPRLKYHNPAVPMTINRTTDQEGPALMTVHFTEPTPTSSSTPAPDSRTSDPPVRIETINMKHRHESEILSQLMTLTKAKPVKPTAEELRQIQELEEHRAQSERDSKRMHEVNEKRKQTEAMLAQARGELAAAKET